MLDPEQIIPGARSTVTFVPTKLARELLAYGEPEAAEQLPHLSARQVSAIGVLAARQLSGPENLVIDKAICLGVVEFLEGKARPLRRNRRFYARHRNARKA